MNSLHNKMMKRAARGEHIMEMAERGELQSTRIGLEQNYVVMESFLKGLLKGLTFANDGGSCKNGLLDLVDQAFNLLEYREIYKPQNTMKFVVSINKLTDAGNTVYA
jgi:hypothetical protein